MRQTNRQSLCSQARFLGDRVEYSEAGRKLSEGIDILLAKNEGSNLKELSEEEITLLEVKNMKFRKGLIKCISDIVEARKVSEMMADSMFEVEYKISGKIKSDDFTVDFERFLPSEK